MLQEEKERNVKEREEALAERISPLNLSGLSAQELVVMIDYNIFVVSQSLQFLLPPDSNTLFSFQWTFYRIYAKAYTTRLIL